MRIRTKQALDQDLAPMDQPELPAQLLEILNPFLDSFRSKIQPCSSRKPRVSHARSHLPLPLPISLFTPRRTWVEAAQTSTSTEVVSERSHRGAIAELIAS